MKGMMERMRDERGIVLYVDLHGHSVKKVPFLHTSTYAYLEALLRM
jgi:hypothetical protein